jgi:hypothetical protein
MTGPERNVFVIAPVFPEDAFTPDRIAAAYGWYWSNVETIEEKYQLKRLHFRELSPGGIFPFPGGATVSYARNGVRSPRVPKGLAVRLALASILDTIDGGGRRPVSNRNTSFVVQIDGSGAFDYSNVERILDKLIFEDIPIVLGQRTGEAWFMSHPDRKKVELFENFLVDRWYLENKGQPIQPSLSDGQAGCWGVNVGALRLMDLTAPSYEIEFDLLATAAMNGCAFSFSQNLMEGRRIGKSGHQASSGLVDHSVAIRKLPFIAHKLGWTKDKIGELLDYYVTQNQDASTVLPREYIEGVRRDYL